MRPPQVQKEAQKRDMPIRHPHGGERKMPGQLKTAIIQYDDAHRSRLANSEQAPGDNSPRARKKRRISTSITRALMRDNAARIAKRKGLSLRVQDKYKSVLELRAQLISPDNPPPIIVGRQLLASLTRQELRRQATLRNIIHSWSDRLLPAIILYDFQ